jgi:hypothetical protein
MILGTITVRTGGRVWVVIGYATDAICQELEIKSRSDHGCIRRIETAPSVKMIQTPFRYAMELPRIFSQYPTNGTFLETTRGVLVKPGLEDRLKTYLMKRHNKYPNADRQTLATYIMEGLEKTATIREKDNLCHLYALLQPAVRHVADIERIFLKLITGSSPNNKHGISVNMLHIHIFCALIEAEGKFGLPTPELAWIKHDPAYRRHERLDLSHVCADLIFARHFERRTGTFSRPMCTSLVCADGYQNGIKPALCEFYGIKDATKPAYMGV